MMNVGESAGYAVALACQKGVDLNQLPTAQLRQFLANKYGE